MMTEASALLEGSSQCLIADRGYDSDAFIEELTSRATLRSSFVSVG